jgi:hypothetical protein
VGYVKAESIFLLAYGDEGLDGRFLFYASDSLTFQISPNFLAFGDL